MGEETRRKVRNQNGCIYVNGESWCLRWRETVTKDGQQTRKLRFKILGEVTSEHRKSGNRKTGRPRTPAEVQMSRNSALPGSATLLPSSHEWAECMVHNFSFMMFAGVLLPGCIRKLGTAFNAPLWILI